jgi:hypothetical protein
LQHGICNISRLGLLLRGETKLAAKLANAKLLDKKMIQMNLPPLGLLNFGTFTLSMNLRLFRLKVTVSPSSFVGKLWDSDMVRVSMSVGGVHISFVGYTAKDAARNLHCTRNNKRPGV